MAAAEIVIETINVLGLSEVNKYGSRCNEESSCP